MVMVLWSWCHDHGAMVMVLWSWCHDHGAMVMVPWSWSAVSAIPPMIKSAKFGEKFDNTDMLA